MLLTTYLLLALIVLFFIGCGVVIHKQIEKNDCKKPQSIFKKQAPRKMTYREQRLRKWLLRDYGNFGAYKNNSSKRHG